MTDRAQKIWDAYYHTLMHSEMTTCYDAVATVIREIANELQYYQFEGAEDMIVSARAIYELADEVEKLGNE